MSSSDLPIPLKRDVAAIQIPAGVSVNLLAGSPVHITQSLGGTFTVALVGQAGLYRIRGEDADALGLEKPKETAEGATGEVSEEQIWEKLKTCYDPEIPVNIVDLGLVYSLEILPAAQGKRVEVKMTLTAQGCGMGPSIAADAREKILTLSAVSEADVQVVWQPPWNPSMISPEGKKRLGMG
ncbi:MAG: putative Fe-S cluster assembly protein SufT [Verrucomicrobiota bacterium]